MKPGKHQGRKQRGQVGGWKVHDHAHPLFVTHTLCMSYVVAMFLLDSCMITGNPYCILPGFVHGQPPKYRTKTYNKDNKEPCRVS